jgi:hypothetical protein
MNNNPRTYLKYAIIAIAIIGLYSCRKALNDLLPDQPLSKKAAWAQEYYNNVLQRNYGNEVNYKTISNKISAVKELTSRPNMKAPMWVRARADKTDRYEFVEVPLTYTTKISAAVGLLGSKADEKILKASFDRLIIYKDKNGRIDQRIITYTPTAAYLERHNGDISHNKINHLDKDFDGFLRYKKWDGTYLYTLKIKKGKAVRKLVPGTIAGNSNKNLAPGNGKLMQGKTADNVLSYGGEDGGEGCIDYYYQEYSQMCYYLNPDDSIPISCDLPVLIYEEYMYTICPGDEGYEDDQTDFCLDPANFETSVCSSTTTDDCASAASATSRAANSRIDSAKNTIIQNISSVEWGAEQNLDSWPGGSGYKNIAPRSGGSGLFATDFSWNATEGYTIGVAHGHPNETGPSPADVFWAVGNLYNTEIASDTAALSFYKKNVTLTTNLPDGTSFIVKINDWAGMTSLYAPFFYDNNLYNATYIQKAQAYITATASEDYGLAAAYALMEIFGDKITIMKAPQGSNTYKPLTKSGFTLSTKNCN